jgi:hypothetical protein
MRTNVRDLEKHCTIQIRWIGGSDVGVFEQLMGGVWRMQSQCAYTIPLSSIDVSLCTPSSRSANPFHGRPPSLEG